MTYIWTDNAMEVGIADANPDIVNECLMHLKYNNSGNNLLDFKWSDHLLNVESWLRADTFSWHSGETYKSAYDHLLTDIQGQSLISETISGITIQYYLSDDGHKVCPISEENNLIDLYNTTGIAWFYLIDTENQRFKLPRTKYGFVGYRSGVGNFVPETLPNIKGDITNVSFGKESGGYVSSGAFIESVMQSVMNLQGGGDNNSSYDGSILRFNASLSSPVYQDNAPVQQRATEMYLYFYVGEFSQSATEQTAGLNAELFNNKLDRDFNNLIVPNDMGKKLDLAGVRTVVETYVNGKSGYRIWSDRFCEQWGYFALGAASANITLLKAYRDLNYNIQLTDGGSGRVSYGVNPISNEYFKIYGVAVGNIGFWQTKGYLADSEEI